MSTRPAAASTCWVNVAWMPPWFITAPGFTLRTRSTAGLKVTENDSVDSRVAPEIDSGTMYGPPPTRNSVPGGLSSTCAGGGVAGDAGAAGAGVGAGGCGGGGWTGEAAAAPVRPAAHGSAAAGGRGAGGRQAERCGGRAGNRRAADRRLRRGGGCAGGTGAPGGPLPGTGAAAAARRRRRRRFGRPAAEDRRRSAHRHVALRADVDRAQVRRRELVRADDARRQQHHDVGLPDVGVVVGEQLLQERHAQDAGEPAQRSALVLAQQPGQQVRLAVAQPQPGGDLARGEGRQGLAGNHRVLAAGAVLQHQVHHDVALVGDPRGHLDDHADRPVGERGQRIGGGAARAPGA